MDEVDVQQRARTCRRCDISGIQSDLTAYVKAANSKLVMEELGKGESGYTVTKPNGKHVIIVNLLETEERQRFTVCPLGAGNSNAS